MPRYDFHLTNGDETLENHKGLDLPGDAAAREQALIVARDLKHGKLMPDRDWAGWVVTVTDQQGREVEAVPIADVPDLA